MKTVTAKQMQRIDRLAQDRFKIPELVLMENAGKAASDEIIRLIAKKNGRKILCLCGPGNNGGDGFVVARHLINRGRDTQVLLCFDEKDIKDSPRSNLQILKEMDISVKRLSDITLPEFKNLLKDSSLIVDAIFGIGLSKPVAGIYADIIALANISEKPIVSLDIPSGLDATSGKVLGHSIKADVTIAFGLAKTGFYKNDGPSNCGKIVVKDISLPKSILN